MRGAVTQQAGLVSIEGTMRVMGWGVLCLFVLEGGVGWRVGEEYKGRLHCFKEWMGSDCSLLD